MTSIERRKLELLSSDIENRLKDGFFSAAQMVVVENYKLKINEILGKKDLWLPFH